MSGPPVVTCAGCQGLTFGLVRCRCTWHGDRFLVDSSVDEESAPGRRATAYRDCLLCQGTGTVTRGCHECGQRGERRAQIVLTVVNADTGAVASASLTPGSLEPTPAYGRWRLAFNPVLDELAAAVAATGLVELTGGGRPVGEQDLLLPRQWHPALPAAQRDALVAAALADHGHNPWRVFQGRTVAPPPVDPTARLTTLCRLADQLHVDLVVELRRTEWGGTDWDLRYELPGAPVSTTPRVRGDDLPAAVVATTVANAFDGFEPRNLAAPGYFLRPGIEQVERAESIDLDLDLDLDQLERRMLRDADDQSGAQAIWRNRRWWHTSLRRDRLAEELTEEPTGQVTRRVTAVLVRGWEPPVPDWRGEPIPYHDCPDCDPGSLLRTCWCRLGGRPADPDCADCGGAGVRAQRLPCHSCGDSHRIQHGAVVSVTDLVGRVVHENWTPRPVAANLVATQPGGKPVVQLSEAYRIASLAERIGRAPTDLTQLDLGQPLCQDLRDGVVTLDDPTDDPVAVQLARATRGRPGGRLLLAARPAAAPPLTELIRVALGLRLAVAITVQDHRLNDGDPLRIHGESWAVEVLSVDPVAPFTDLPTQPSLAAAVASCVTYLEVALAAAVPADPRRPIPVPQTPVPAPAADPGPLVARLGHHFSGRPVTVRLDGAGCTVHLHEYGVTQLLASAPTVPAALSALGLRVADWRC
ncbi:hypothetical protein [Plantactinospora sp. B5E13]|uniref:hypothetical protein n=1 Tax=Plantactinospora sp. B5E13 TaxID=3153758 RepID=UPI00325E4DA1